MDPTARTPDDESAFMAALLSGMDTSLPTHVRDGPKSSSREKPIKRQPQLTVQTTAIVSTPSKKKHSPKSAPRSARRHASPSKSPRKEELSALLDGAEDWDWDDMNSDFLTPKKPKAEPVNSLPVKVVCCMSHAISDCGFRGCDSGPCSDPVRREISRTD